VAHGADAVPLGIITSIRAKRKIGAIGNIETEISETYRLDARDNPALNFYQRNTLWTPSMPSKLSTVAI
jgi:hypothetical protein